MNSDNGYAALYFPWIAISNPFAAGQILVPPSGHLAGVYANNDTNFGVFQAPANETITSALALPITVTDDEQGPLNEQGINIIRSFPNQGIKIWGARTIAPPDVTAWRFVNVRRLVTFIEKSIQEGTRFAVFEPNNLTLWQQIKRMVTDFLTQQWTDGALFGDTPDKAFRVRVDETLNPPQIARPRAAHRGGYRGADHAGRIHHLPGDPGHHADPPCRKKPATNEEDNMAQDPYKGFRFRVEIQGIQQAGFMECSSVGSHIEVVEYREGGESLGPQAARARSAIPTSP